MGRVDAGNGMLKTNNGRASFQTDPRKYKYCSSENLKIQARSERIEGTKKETSAGHIDFENMHVTFWLHNIISQR